MIRLGPASLEEAERRIGCWADRGFIMASDIETKSTHLIPTIRDLGGVLGMEIATGRVVVLRHDTEGY